MFRVYSVALVRIERQYTGRQNNVAPGRVDFPPRPGAKPARAVDSSVMVSLSPDYLMPQLYQDSLLQPGYV